MLSVSKAKLSSFTQSPKNTKHVTLTYKWTQLLSSLSLSILAAHCHFLCPALKLHKYLHNHTIMWPGTQSEWKLIFPSWLPFVTQNHLFQMQCSKNQKTQGEQIFSHRHSLQNPLRTETEELLQAETKLSWQDCIRETHTFILVQNPSEILTLRYFVGYQQPTHNSPLSRVNSPSSVEGRKYKIKLLKNT